MDGVSVFLSKEDFEFEKVKSTIRSIVEKALENAK